MSRRISSGGYQPVKGKLGSPPTSGSVVSGEAASGSRCPKCDAGPIGNCGYYGCETPRETCPLRATPTLVEGSAPLHIDLLTKAVGDITAALIMAGKEDKVADWTSPYVAAINLADASPSPSAEQGDDECCPPHCCCCDPGEKCCDCGQIIASSDEPVAIERNIARYLKDEPEDGHWRACSGCHELNEGHDTGPINKSLGCVLGLGCSECGGLGAIWDSIDYADMAEWMQRRDRDHENVKRLLIERGVQPYAAEQLTVDILALEYGADASPPATEKQLEAVRQQVINSPETAEFMAGLATEAAHQRERWHADHDAGKSPYDWFWLIGYLAQKAADAQARGDAEKALHHTISTAAVLGNWHAAISGTSSTMRPGIEPRSATISEPLS